MILYIADQKSLRIPVPPGYQLQINNFTIDNGRIVKFGEIKVIPFAASPGYADDFKMRVFPPYSIWQRLQTWFRRAMP